MSGLIVAETNTKLLQLGKTSEGSGRDSLRLTPATDAWKEPRTGAKERGRVDRHCFGKISSLRRLDVGVVRALTGPCTRHIRVLLYSAR
jgi:hypothetical protein